MVRACVMRGFESGGGERIGGGVAPRGGGRGGGVGTRVTAGDAFAGVGETRIGAVCGGGVTTRGRAGSIGTSVTRV